jgi:hypothetical protein
MKVLVVLSGFLVLSSCNEFGKFNKSRDGNGNETFDSVMSANEKGCLKFKRKE